MWEYLVGEKGSVKQCNYVKTSMIKRNNYQNKTVK